MLCKDCPKRAGCTEICDDLGQELPNMMNGMYSGGPRAEALHGDDAIIALWKDGKKTEEIAYHVPVTKRRIRQVIHKAILDEKNN